MNNRIKKDDDVVCEKINGSETYVFDPYNPLNKEITAAEVQNVLAKYNVFTPIHQFVLYNRAFVHRSYTRRPHAWNEQNNITIVPNQKIVVNCIQNPTNDWNF